MSKRRRTPTTDDWKKKYTPVENTYARNGWGWDDKCHMFETFGIELDFIKRQDPKTVWTLVDEDGKTYLIAGIHWVNRLGYVVSEEPWSDPDEIYRD